MKNLIVAVIIFLSPLPAYAFLVSDFEGKRTNVHEYVGDGRWTVVMLWQLGCVPCEKQKPAVEAFHEKYKASKAHVLGLVMDGHESIPEIQSFLETQSVGFPSLVVFGDVFNEQVVEETGKGFPASPGYIIYSPAGQVEFSVNSMVNIEELLGFIETQFK